MQTPNCHSSASRCARHVVCVRPLLWCSPPRIPVLILVWRPCVYGRSGMDWDKYAAAMASDAPTADRLRLKLNRLEMLASLAAEGGTTPSATLDASARTIGSARDTARSNGSALSARDTARSSARVSEASSTTATTLTSSAPQSARAGGGTTKKMKRGGGRHKIGYTRDGRLLDHTMRSEEEAALIERVQGHASLAPPTAAHPSIAKYVGDDGSSLVGEGGTTIAPKAHRIDRSLLPRWQVEKERANEERAQFRRTHIDYGLLTPTQASWTPGWQLARGGRVEAIGAAAMRAGGASGTTRVGARAPTSARAGTPAGCSGAPRSARAADVTKATRAPFADIVW